MFKTLGFGYRDGKLVQTVYFGKTATSVEHTD